jgi:hypothetical protein
MTRSSLLKKLNLKGWGLEFWLPLPLVAILFWFGGDIVNRQLLSHAYDPNRYLQTDVPAKIKFSASVLSIEVEMKRKVNFTKVIVKTTHSPLKTLEFEFPLMDVAEVEVALAKELNLSVETVRQLARYQFTE